MLVSDRACHPPNDSLGGLSHRLGNERGRLLQGLRARGYLAILPDAPEIPYAVRVAWALVLHVGVPALITWLPTTTGMRLRDFADFYPEQAAVGDACVASLVAGGLAKLCGGVGSRVAFHRCL